ncbi:hypothetical protein LTR56_011844 [Elasticomyces elasticus]|nr:hypothetical protein LTR56_011844 [Elasticomyces elasticus]KAK3666428.1 hypothetical protein LTR22_002733 [Elasticomyces elasticus]KAK4931247.1 hypothetical protein LTR49_002305 [Elasticomyces elasticus]KAK5767822.1 hypothetical protein LTS12_001974 [Elasticomyces elasticus]
MIRLSNRTSRRRSTRRRRVKLIDILLLVWVGLLLHCGAGLDSRILLDITSEDMEKYSSPLMAMLELHSKTSKTQAMVSGSASEAKQIINLSRLMLTSGLAKPVNEIFDNIPEAKRPNGPPDITFEHMQ